MKKIKLAFCILGLFLTSFCQVALAEQGEFDVLGLRLGMTEQEVDKQFEALREKGVKSLKDQRACCPDTLPKGYNSWGEHLFLSNKLDMEGYGHSSIGFMYLTTNPQAMSQVGRQVNGSSGPGFPSIGNSFYVYFPPPGTRNTSYGIWREQRFPTDNQSRVNPAMAAAPTLAQVDSALRNRYGAPAEYIDTNKFGQPRTSGVSYVWGGGKCPNTTKKTWGQIPTGRSVPRDINRILVAENKSCDPVLIIVVSFQSSEYYLAKKENRSPLIGRVETTLLNIGAVIDSEIKYSAIAEAYEDEQKRQSQSKRAAPEF